MGVQCRLKNTTFCNLRATKCSLIFAGFSGLLVMSILLILNQSYDKNSMMELAPSFKLGEYEHGNMLLKLRPRLKSLILMKQKNQRKMESRLNKVNSMKIDHAGNFPPKNEFLSQDDPLEYSPEDQTKAAVLRKLSADFQANLTALQNPRSCISGKFLKCGYEKHCGFGCSFHHHMGCLILSYAINLPLLHNERQMWNYKAPWSKFFHPIGSNCSAVKTGETDQRKLLKWDWRKYKTDLKEFRIKQFKHEYKIMGPPQLSQGIPVPPQFGKELEKHHENPFLWMIGQFAQSAFYLKGEVLTKIKEYEKSLRISKDRRKHPLIGMHVRRTDKYRETVKNFTDDDFMNAAIKYRENWILQQNNISKDSSNFPAKKGLEKQRWTVFIASEDFRVLHEFRTRFTNSSWSFVGDESVKKVLDLPKTRKKHLYDIIRDIVVLSHCDYVICTISSNVCRLLMDIAGFRHLQPSRHFKLLDGEYKYRLASNEMTPKLQLVQRN